MSNNKISQISASILCSYKNHTPNIQVGRIDDASGNNVEKVIFPGETFLFEAQVNAKLIIFVELADKITLLESVPCSELQTKAMSKVS
ncbi:MAG: DUF1830 domain-containing protein [Cyanobacteria bacterium P01_G01_bin.39]